MSNISARAKALLDDELLASVLDDMERSTIDACINAKPIDHETRAAMAAEVRAIRTLKAKLRSKLEEVNPPFRGAPA